MTFKKIFYLILAVSFGISIYFVLQMPEVVPVHWNAAGEIDGYGSRYFYALFACLPMLVYLGMGFTRKIDPKQKQLKRNEEAYEMFRYITSGFMILLNAVILLSAMNTKVDVPVIISGVTGLMFIVMGNYLPRIPQNYFVGIKLPWTIDNEYVWTKTHRVGGYVFILSGILMILSGFIKSNLSVVIVLITVFANVFGLAVYSYILYKKTVSNV